MNTRNEQGRITHPLLTLLALVCIFGIIISTITMRAAQTRTYSSVSTNEALQNVPTGNQLTNLSTNTTQTEVLDVSRMETFGFTITAQNSATNPQAHTLGIGLKRSWDGGATFETTPFTVLLMTLAGTTPQTWGTNITVGDATHVQVADWRNTATNGVITNISAKITAKPKWRSIVPTALTP